MIRSFNLTLDGNAQQLSAALSLTAEKDVPIKAIVMQPHGTNAAVIYVGGSDVSSTLYGWRLEAASAGIPPAPFILGEVANQIGRLSELYVKGTNTEILHIAIVT